MKKSPAWGLIVSMVVLGAGWAAAARAAEVDEFRIKRQEVFEFTRKPTVNRDGDHVLIRFASKAFCDATVAVEDGSGKIVRHLASGVLGANAPEPLQKNSLTQAVAWDGKDDQGQYLKDSASCVVRVSLGLRPVFERTLFWSPHKRLTEGKAIDGDAARVCATPEGVYVSDGTGVDSVRLFDHQGDYVRTIYPFAADKLKDIKGLNFVTFPQDGQSLPLGVGMMHATLLTSGSSASGQNKYGYGAQFLAAHGSRIAIGFNRLNRLSADASAGGLALEGPAVDSAVIIGVEDLWARGKPTRATPHSAAFSPDGKWLYLSGFGWCGQLGRAQDWLGGVTRMAFDADQPPELFAGSIKQGDYGAGQGQFKWATSVAVDAQGRAYVADHLNSRIQVFSPDGKFIKAIGVNRPVFVGVHHRTGEIYVLSWRLGSDDPTLSPPVKTPTYTRLGPLDNPQTLATFPLPFLRDYDVGRGGSSRLIGGGMQYAASLDSWATETTLWLFPGRGATALLLIEKDGKLQVRRDLNHDVQRAVTRTTPPIIQRQRLYVNPSNGRLYVGEADAGVMKSFKQLVEIDPDGGRTRLVDLPFDAEDLCIDLNGLFYLRTDVRVGRYDPAANWREVPWDYGEEAKAVTFGGGGDGRQADLMAALPLPATGRPGNWHLGGMAISARGRLAVTCYNTTGKPREWKDDPFGTPEANMKKGFVNLFQAQKYRPMLYPGRATGWETHIWDEHGKLARQDVTPGLTSSDGIGIDRNDDLYVLASPNRMLNGKPYPISTAETLVKIRPGKTKVISGAKNIPVPLETADRPARLPDMNGASLPEAWADGVEWMYGGVGLNNMACICWNARPALDLFGRSFAPEINHFSVAVLDTAGNLMLRVGRYGNVDDGKPLVAEGGPPNARNIGGDEVSLSFGAYLATHSDRRLFIADAGNGRIVSVKLEYHATEKVSLNEK